MLDFLHSGKEEPLRTMSGSSQSLLIKKMEPLSMITLKPLMTLSHLMLANSWPNCNSCGKLPGKRSPISMLNEVDIIRRKI